MELTPEEVRVLGCLLEKQRTTPDAYPLTVNALISACNQTTNRDPVVTYDEATVELALEGLRAKDLARRGVYPGSRVAKHRQIATETLALAPPEAAVLGVLLLRGPQTPGELKARTERWHGFADLAEVEAALEALAHREDAPPLVVRREREPGRKEHRWAARLGAAGAEAPGEERAAPSEVATTEPAVDRLAALEARVAALEARLDELGA